MNWYDNVNEINVIGIRIEQRTWVDVIWSLVGVFVCHPIWTFQALWMVFRTPDELEGKPVNKRYFDLSTWSA